MSRPLIGRCANCDYAVFATEEDIPDGKTFRDILAGGVCRVGGREFGRCTNGHKFFPLKYIKGTYSESFKCDSRCLNAKGHECTCSCGGANHGRGHAVKVLPVQVNASVRYESASGPPHDEPEEVEDFRQTRQYLGQTAEKIYFDGKLVDRREINDTILFIFMTEVRTPITGEFLGEAKIEWWKPDWLDDPGYTVGEVYKLKAKVKRHDDHPRWGKSTVVTYLEEV
jgi:hypothetical protein